jgi:CheY-like chemotaxis protein
MWERAKEIFGSDPGAWSPTLRNAITLCVATKTPMQLWWGPSLTLLYNDAATAEIHVWAARAESMHSDVERVRQTGEPARAGALMLVPLFDLDYTVAGVACTCVRDSTYADASVAVNVDARAASTSTRLLVVEGNDERARALEAGLVERGYEVALAHDAPIALNLARSFHPDVVVVDLGLPVMDGWELGKRLRLSSRELPLVAIGASHQPGDEQRLAEIGFCEHLIKPIDLAELDRIVRRLSDQRP